MKTYKKYNRGLFFFKHKPSGAEKARVKKYSGSKEAEKQINLHYEILKRFRKSFLLGNCETGVKGHPAEVRRVEGTMFEKQLDP